MSSSSKKVPLAMLNQSLTNVKRNPSKYLVMKKSKVLWIISGFKVSILNTASIRCINSLFLWIIQKIPFKIFLGISHPTLAIFIMNPSTCSSNWSRIVRNGIILAGMSLLFLSCSSLPVKMRMKFHLLSLAVRTDKESSVMIIGTSSDEFISLHVKRNSSISMLLWFFMSSSIFRNKHFISSCQMSFFPINFHDNNWIIWIQISRNHVKVN